MKKILYGKCPMPTYEQSSLSQCLILILSNLNNLFRMKNVNWINNNYKIFMQSILFEFFFTITILFLQIWAQHFPDELVSWKYRFFFFESSRSYPKWVYVKNSSSKRNYYYIIILHFCSICTVLMSFK